MMKLGLKASSILLVIVLIFGVSILASADEKTISLVTNVLQSFDPDEEDLPNYRTWALIPSKFGYDREGNSYWEKKLVDAWPEALFGRNREKKEYRVLGIHGKFRYKGYNYVEIVPGTGEGDSFESKPIPILGRVQMLDTWVWGSNHNYYLEAHVRDADGIIHVLPLGSIQHVGWKNHSVKFSGSIRQAWQYIPKFRQLVLTKFVLWTRPEEKVDDFYMYIDHIKVLTDMFESSFDGDELAEKEALEDIWGVKTD